MYVGNKMITDIISVSPDASISQAFQKMHERGVSQLPVVQNGKLVGLITETLLSEFTPSKATTLSIYELNYILGKTKVDSIMEKDVITCSEDMLIEEVAKIMNANDINMVPVINDNQTLVGIISRSDIIESFIEITGAMDPGGSRITINSKDEAGKLAEISSIIKDYGVNITHLTSFKNASTDNAEIIIRLNTQDVTPIIQALENKGYEIIRIDHN
ncbi:CBS and ACT domain-containing protein [Vallitaleaceae bacterium 9-2]